MGQVANFRTESAIPCQGFRRDCRRIYRTMCWSSTPTKSPLDFHATYTAKRKRYRYVIQNGRATHPFLRNYAQRVSRPAR